VIVFSLALEQIKNILHAKLANRLSALDRGLGEFALCLLELEDALFDRVVDGEAVDCDVDGLVEAVDAVDGLFFDELFASVSVYAI
jgi:hypothetical protein